MERLINVSAGREGIKSVQVNYLHGVTPAQFALALRQLTAGEDVDYETVVISTSDQNPPTWAITMLVCFCVKQGANMVVVDDRKMAVVVASNCPGHPVGESTKSLANDNATHAVAGRR